MTGGREILNKIKVKTGLGGSSSDTGKGKSKVNKHIRHGFHLVKGKSNHAMEDYVFAEFKSVSDHELGLFAIFDGHLGHDVADYLKTHLFENILSQNNFWDDTENAIKSAYSATDAKILEKSAQLGKGGSTAVTCILIDGERLVVANIGDSRAVISKNGEAEQLSFDHEPISERQEIERKGGFVSNFPAYYLNPMFQYSRKLGLDVTLMSAVRDITNKFFTSTEERTIVMDEKVHVHAKGFFLQLTIKGAAGTYSHAVSLTASLNVVGDVPRVDGQLAVARAFGDRSLKVHLSSEPFVTQVNIDVETDFLILASDGLWKVMTNQQAVDAIKGVKDPKSAAVHLTEEAVNRKSKDDISCIVVCFH